MSKLNKALLWILFILALLTPLLSRFLSGHPLTPLDTSYKHFLTSSSLYDILLQTFPTPFLPFLLGLITFALLIMLIDARYFHVLFIIMPLTITLFTTHNPATLFFLLALAMYVLSRTNLYLSLLAIPLLVFTDVLAAIVMLLSAMAYHAKSRHPAIIAGLVVLIASVVVSFRTGFGYVQPEYVPLFGEFGSAYGYSLFIILLSLVFIVEHWRSLNATPILLWLSGFAVSAYSVTLRPLLLLPLALYAANALSDLQVRNWRLTLLKQASFFLLVCLGMFVIITHTKLLVEATPQVPLVSLIEYTTDPGVPRPGAILTITEHQEFVDYYGTRPVVAIAVDDPFWQTVSLTDARSFLQENKVRYILITPGMTGTAWQANEGFRFLIQNNDKFTRVRQEGEYELWLVLTEFL